MQAKTYHAVHQFKSDVHVLKEQRALPLAMDAIMTFSNKHPEAIIGGEIYKTNVENLPLSSPMYCRGTYVATMATAP